MKTTYAESNENFSIGTVFVKWVIQLSHNIQLFLYECIIGWSVEIKL